MSVDTLEKLSPFEYLETERKSDVKHEYIDGTLIPMSGASIFHNIICSNLLRILGNTLEDQNYIICGSDLKVFLPLLNRYVYPDTVVIQGTPHTTDQHTDTITNPSVIIEVLSESTEGYDRGDKFQAYRSVESLQEYVLVSQDKPLIEVFTRQEDGWYLHDAKGLDQIIRLQTLSYDLPLKEVYAKVKLAQ